MAYLKYNGIDRRQIICAGDPTDSIEPGISFDESNGYPTLRFHYLEYLELKHKRILLSRTKEMYLDKQNIKELINSLTEIYNQL